MKNIDIIPFLELEKGDCILLFGQMGAGKTYFTRHLCEHLQCEQKACSPTYTLTNHYYCEKFLVIHSDLYRLNIIDAFIMEELQSKDSLNIIEWAEKLGAEALEQMPNRLHLHFDPNTHELTKIEKFGRFETIPLSIPLIGS